ncbi:MAG: FHA domain-containing protein [Myxococcota bacterium]|nr:FHA domain-containing protein [Myxococcota bacterium]
MADKDKPITLDDDDFSLIEDDASKKSSPKTESDPPEEKFFSAPTTIDDNSFSSPEHTVIDPEIAARFMRHAESQSQANKEDLTKPEPPPSDVPPEQSASESALLKENVEVDKMLPPEDSRLGDGPISVDFSDSLMQQENTSPKLEIPTGISSLKPEEDDWDDLEKSQAGWRSITGESDVKMVPEELWEKSYGNKNTDVYDEEKEAKGLLETQQKVKKQNLARMIGLKGKDNSKEFDINQPQTSLGRGSSNDIVLKDASISRYHARIQRDQEGYMIIDQRSGNGTFVNSQRVSQNRLRSGDEFTLGKATFRFLEIGDAYKSAPSTQAPNTPTPQKTNAQEPASDIPKEIAPPSHAMKTEKPYLVYIAVSVCILLLAMAVLGITFYRRHTQKQQTQQTLVTQTYYDGIEAFKERKWKEAEQKFLILASLDANQTSSTRYLKRIKHEKIMQNLFKEAQKDFKNGFLAEAFTKCKDVKDSVYESDARKLLSSIPEAIPRELKNIAKQIERGRIELALKKLASMGQIWPKKSDIARLKAKALRIRGEQNKKNAVSTKKAPEPSSQLLKKTHLGTVIQAKALFADNKIKDAITLLEGLENASAQKVRSSLLTIQEKLPNALEQHRLKRAGAALSILNDIYRHTLELADSESSFALNIRQKIADMHCLSGIQSSLSGDLPATYRNLKSALRTFPQHRLAQRKMQELTEKANKILRQAQTNQDPESARKQLNTVTQISAPESTLYQKAKAALEKLP